MVVGAIAIVWRGVRRGISLERLICELVFYGYLAGVAAVTLFPITFDGNYIQQMRHDTSIADGVNLIPIAGLGLGGGIGKQLFENIILGIPFGFGLPFLGVPAGRRVLLVGVMFAFGIEALQFAMDLAYGFPYRTVDVNDALLNFAGVGIGLGLFYLARVAYRLLKLTQADVGDYLHAVFVSR